MADDTQVTEDISQLISATTNLNRPELSHVAKWTLSSHKYGFGVENLRDDNENTFWQSEGAQPHTIDLRFPKRVLISAVAIRTSHPRDDSYTPSKVSVRAGNSVHDLQEVQLKEFHKPDGWIHIPLRPMNADSGDGAEVEEGPPIPCYHLQILIVANHINGKDTHVRGLKVFGPLDSSDLPTKGVNAAGAEEAGVKVNKGRKLLMTGHDGLSGFTSVAFKMHEGIR